MKFSPGDRVRVSPQYPCGPFLATIAEYLEGLRSIWGGRFYRIIGPDGIDYEISDGYLTRLSSLELLAEAAE